MGQGWRTSIQRSHRCLRQNSEIRWYPRSLPWFRYLLRRYLHLSWHVFRSLRFIETHPLGRRRISRFVILVGLGCYHYCRLMSYPIDTIRRRMMMTSGGGVKYKGSIDCGLQILKNEGFMSMMKGAGANVLRGVAGAGVLAGFDKFKAISWH